MLKIRLQRVGRRRDPSFRIVLTDSRRAPQSGGFLEILGNYDPRKPAREAARIKSERAAYWLTHGAQLSGTVHNLFIDAKLISGAKRNVSPGKRAGAVSATAPSERVPAQPPAAPNEDASAVPSPADTDTQTQKEPATAVVEETPKKNLQDDSETLSAAV